MRNLLATLFILFVAGLSSAQTIGSSFNEVKKSYPEGDLVMDDDKTTYHYTVDENDAHTIYLMDLNLNVIGIIFIPMTSESRQEWVEMVNDSWVVISNIEWKYYRDNGMVLNMKMKTLENGIVFIIKED